MLFVLVTVVLPKATRKYIQYRPRKTWRQYESLPRLRVFAQEIFHQYLLCRHISPHRPTMLFALPACSCSICRLSYSHHLQVLHAIVPHRFREWSSMLSEGFLEVSPGGLDVSLQRELEILTGKPARPIFLNTLTEYFPTRTTNGV